MKLRRQRKHRSRRQRIDLQLEEVRLEPWYWPEEVKDLDYEQTRAICLDPETDEQLLLRLTIVFPREVARNPMVPLLALANPDAWRRALTIKPALFLWPVGRPQKPTPQPRRSWDSRYKRAVKERRKKNQQQRREEKRAALELRRMGVAPRAPGLPCGPGVVLAVAR